jgi:hypothetical protein
VFGNVWTSGEDRQGEGGSFVDFIRLLNIVKVMKRRWMRWEGRSTHGRDEDCTQNFRYEYLSE